MCICSELSAEAAGREPLYEDGSFPSPTNLCTRQALSPPDRACLAGRDVWLSMYLQQGIIAGGQDRPIGSRFC